MRISRLVLALLLAVTPVAPVVAQEESPTVMRLQLPSKIFFSSTGGGNGGGETEGPGDPVDPEEPDGGNEGPPDNSGNSQPLQITVAGAIPLYPTVGDPISLPLQLRGGMPPYDLAVTGANPFSFATALDQPNDATLEGFFSNPGFYSFAFNAKDSAAPTAKSVDSSTYTVEVSNPLTASWAGGFSFRAGKSAGFVGPTPAGGRGMKTFSLVGGLPPGLSFNPSTGGASGTAAGLCNSCSMTVRVTDVDGRQFDAVASYNTYGELALSSPSNAPTFRRNVPITPIQLNATNVIGTPLYEIGLNNLPAGLTLDPATGLITGTPTGLGNYGAFRARVTDDLGTAWTADIAGVVVAPTVTVASTQTGNVGQPFTVTPSYGLLVSGGPHTRQYSLGGAPAGMTISSSGVISWATPVAGTYPISVEVADTDGSVGGSAFSLTIYPEVAADGGTVTPTNSATSTSNSRTVTWTFPRLVYINTWTAQAKVWKSGGSPTLYVLLQYLDANGVWQVANQGNYTGSSTANSSTKAVLIGPSYSATARVEAKQFRITLNWGASNQTATSPSIGTDNGMH